MSEKLRILFVCTGNTCRSPMAQGALSVLLEKERSGRFQVSSCGTGAAEGFPATAYATEAAKIWQADIFGHKSQPLTTRLVNESDLIFGMSASHVKEALRLGENAEGKTYLLKNFPDNNPDGEGVEDPIGQPLDRYNETFLEIGEFLGRHLAGIIALIDGKTNDS